MNAESIFDYCSQNAVIRFAKKNYETYVSHYRERNLTPMTFEEFLKNYSGS